MKKVDKTQKKYVTKFNIELQMIERNKVILDGAARKKFEYILIERHLYA